MSFRLISPTACRVAGMFGLISLLSTTISRSAQAQGDAYEQLQAFSGVLSQVRLNYVDSVDFASLVQASIRGMLRSLDPHSHYVTRREFDLEVQWDRGVLGAPGLTVDDYGRMVTVLAVAPDGPAARAGVQPGDRVLRVNDSTIIGVGARSVEARLLGDIGSKVRLTLERGNALAPDTLSVTLKRATLPHRVVSSPRMADAQTGYVRLEQFTPPASKELSKAIHELRGMGAKQLILDLRGNPGGDVEAMVAVTNSFLPRHTEVFHTQSRRKTASNPVSTTDEGEFAKLPLILLIDAESASASETMAGAFQDHDRALIVGRRSFGKALIQTSLPLPNGDVVWLTTARVVTPSGRVIQRRYIGMGVEQYFEQAGRGGAPDDTSAVYHTDAGREVRGGGGILPDVAGPIPADLPAWFSVAADSGFLAIADSVEGVLGKDNASRRAWISDSLGWDARLVEPFLRRVQGRLGVAGVPAQPLRARIGRILAQRAALSRWGPEAAEDFLIANDGDIRLALQQFPRIPALLKPLPRGP
jgi:carboxyl-terminal processing protease